MSPTVTLFATVWHAEAFFQENVLDVTLRVRYNVAKVCNMTRYYSEMSNAKIVPDILFSDQRHIYINRQSYQEAIDVGNKVITQNNIQKIANSVILQRVLFIKLVS